MDCEVQADIRMRLRSKKPETCSSHCDPGLNSWTIRSYQACLLMLGRSTASFSPCLGGSSTSTSAGWTRSSAHYVARTRMRRGSNQQKRSVKAEQDGVSYAYARSDAEGQTGFLGTTMSGHSWAANGAGVVRVPGWVGAHYRRVCAAVLFLSPCSRGRGEICMEQVGGVWDCY